jgi:hypothetical protein
MTKKDWLSTIELANEWGLAPNTLEQWRSRGIGPPAHHLNRVIRYFRPEGEHWAGLHGDILPETKAKLDAIAKGLEASTKGEK